MYMYIYIYIHMYKNHNKNALWSSCFQLTSFAPLLFLLGELKLNDDDEDGLFLWYG